MTVAWERGEGCDDGGGKGGGLVVTWLSDEVTNDGVESDADDDKEASDSENTYSDEDENLNLNQNDDEEEEYVRTPDSFEFNDDDEEYEELYKDVNTKYEQVKDDEHVTLTTVHDTKKTERLMQSSSVSFYFANQFLNLDNILPTDTEFVSIMNVTIHHEEPSTQTSPLLNIPVTVIPKTSTAAESTIPPTIPSITPLQQQSTPTPNPAPTTTTSVLTLLDFSSIFG
nr:hypothetical protein [Tanacetum cinerariifolium]